MTRLTLEWHLRGLINGPTDPEYEVVGTEEVAGKSFDVTEKVKEGSYTTGFTQESGVFCDALEIPASQVLASDDPVKCLDAIAHDPTRRMQERSDAAWLLDKHIWPESPDNQVNGVIAAKRDDIDVREWTDAGMVGRKIGPMCKPIRCKHSACMEGECLADPDILRDEGIAVCMACGTEQPIPEYP